MVGNLCRLCVSKQKVLEILFNSQQWYLTFLLFQLFKDQHLLSYKLVLKYYISIHVYFEIFGCKAEIANTDIFN